MKTMLPQQVRELLFELRVELHPRHQGIMSRTGSSSVDRSSADRALPFHGSPGRPRDTRACGESPGHHGVVNHDQAPRATLGFGAESARPRSGAAPGGAAASTTRKRLPRARRSRRSAPRPGPDDAVAYRRPSPVPMPTALVVKNGSKMRRCDRTGCRARCRGPRPERDPPQGPGDESDLVLSVRVGGNDCAAFTRRLMKTWPSRPSSASTRGTSP